MTTKKVYFWICWKNDVRRTFCRITGRHLSIEKTDLKGNEFVSLSHTRTHVHTHTHSLSLSFYITHTLTLFLTHSLSITHTHTLTLFLSLSHTHTQTLSLSLSNFDLHNFLQKREKNHFAMIKNPSSCIHWVSNMRTTHSNKLPVNIW